MAGKRAPESKPQEEPPYDRCRTCTGAERQCWFPATFYGVSGKRGGGECRLHYRAPGSAIESIIEESERWHQARLAGKDVPFEYVRHDGRRVAGFPSTEQIERRRAAESAAFCKQRGLDTPEKVRKFAVAGAAAIRAKRGFGVKAQVREPGQDDE